jgi:hypothetical protein
MADRRDRGLHEQARVGRDDRRDLVERVAGVRARGVEVPERAQMRLVPRRGPFDFHLGDGLTFARTRRDREPVRAVRSADAIAMRPAAGRELQLVGDQESIDLQHLVEIAKPRQIARLDTGDACPHKSLARDRYTIFQALGNVPRSNACPRARRFPAAST